MISRAIAIVASAKPDYRCEFGLDVLAMIGDSDEEKIHVVFEATKHESYIVHDAAWFALLALGHSPKSRAVEMRRSALVTPDTFAPRRVAVAADLPPFSVPGAMRVG